MFPSLLSLLPVLPPGTGRYAARDVIASIPDVIGLVASLWACGSARTRGATGYLATRSTGMTSIRAA